MNYDGPSFNYRRKRVEFDPFKKDDTKKNGKHDSNELNFNLLHSNKLPKQVRTRRDYQNEAEKILSSKTNQDSFFETKRERKYRPRFRVTEVPSPMFGYTEEQKERMGLKEHETEEEIEWNYKALKELMLKHPYDFILTEECLNASILKEWQS